MDIEKGKFQFAGLKFLYEMELVDDPQLINNMKLNILDISGTIRDVEFLSSYNHRAMLIYVDVNWLGKTFFMKQIEAGILDRVKQLLPNFRFRVTADRKILDLSIEKVKTALKGEPNENANKPVTSNVPNASENQRVAIPVAEATSTELPKESDLLQDSKVETKDQ